MGLLVPTLGWGSRFNPDCFAMSLIPRGCVTGRAVVFDMSVLFVVGPMDLWPVHRESHASGKRNKGLVVQVLKLKKGPSPLNLRIFNGWLYCYPNWADAEYLSSSFQNGFRIPAQGVRQAYISGNLKSVQGVEQIVWNKIAKEVREGEVLGPFVAPILLNLKGSPLGVVPKKEPGKFRLIRHLSYPRWASVIDANTAHLSTARHLMRQ